MKINKKENPKWYDVKVECLLPATLTYRVLAETPEDAGLMIKNMTPNGVRHRLVGRRDIKLMVFDSGSTIIRFIKNIIR